MNANRTIAEGTDLIAFLEEGTLTKTYRPLAAQTGCSISDDGDELESTSKNNGNTANYQYGRDRWGATVDIMIPADTDVDEVDFHELRLMRRAKVKPVIFFAYVDADGDIDTTRPAYRGTVLLKTPIEAPDGELMKTTITMKGCGVLEDLKYVTTAWVLVAATYPAV